MNDVLDATLCLSQALERSGFDYVIGGAIALAYWTEPRATTDIDITIDVEIPGLSELLSVLRGCGCSFDEERVIRAAERGDFGVQMEGIRLDIFLVNMAHTLEALARKRRVPLAGGEIWVMSPEDVLLTKVVFARKKDWADLERLVASQRKNLDWNYVDEWLRRLFPNDDERLAEFKKLRAAFS